MNFDKKYPNALVDFQPKTESIFKCGGNLTCWHCGKTSNWIDYCFEAALCSEECYQSKWQEYQEAAEIN